MTYRKRRSSSGNATSEILQKRRSRLPFAMLLDYDRCVTVRCLQCGKPLNKCRGRSARYCEAKCRAAQYRLQDLLDTLPASITTLYQRLREHAPEQARAYRLVRAQPDGIWQYPRSDGKPWRAFTGRSHRPAFRLWPFEIPTVDRVAVYGVLLLGRHGLIARPQALLDGIALDPVLEHPSEGERIR